jgi:hypothetical protein
MTLATRIRATRTALANRQTQTPAERTELDEVLGRHTAEETREIRAILDQQDAARLQRVPFVSGYRI